ncbi:MAG: septal ring lytic transglycosylase RlpA family protein [bacterium]
MAILVRLVLVLALIGISAFPPQALAFEANLASSPSQRLLATITLNEVDYSQRISGSVLAQPSVVVESGKWHKPSRLAYVAGGPVVLEGEASYYSRAGCLGCSPLLTMANGQPLDDNALTMAIGADRKHLVGRTAKVTSLATGQSVNVLITDTGGFYNAKYGHRVADLTVATKQAIGMKGGVGQVRVEIY